MRTNTANTVIPKLLALRKLRPQAAALKKESLRWRDEPLAVLKEEMAKEDGEPELPSSALTEWASSLEPYVDDLQKIIGLYLFDQETFQRIEEINITKKQAQELALVFGELSKASPLPPTTGTLHIPTGTQSFMIDPRTVFFHLSQHFKKIATKDDSLKS